MTAGFVYLRLHGKKAEHAWDYSREELQPEVDKVGQWNLGALETLSSLRPKEESNTNNGTLCVCPR